MREDLIRDSVQLLILTVVNDFPHDHCWDCESFQDLIGEIERYGKKDAEVVIGPLKVPKERVRASYRCETCPPNKARAWCSSPGGERSKTGAGRA